MKLRFSIRDLLWLTLVAALCLGWTLSYLKTSQRAKRAEGKLIIVLDKIQRHRAGQALIAVYPEMGTPPFQYVTELSNE